MHKVRAASRRSGRPWNSWAGARPAICGSISAGARNDVDRDRGYAAELVALGPDVILASGTLSVAALQRVTHTVPIVFVEVSDPVGAGFVDTLARPGGNITGFMLFEYSLSGKWLELLKEIAPRLTRAAVLRDSANPAGIAQFGAIQVHGAVARGRGEPDQMCARPARSSVPSRPLPARE